MWLQKYLALALIVAALSSGGLTRAQTARRLAYGESVTDILEEREAHRWQFAGRAGDLVLADMRVPFNTLLDPQLSLLDPQGRLLAQDEDSGGALYARLLAVRLPQTGTYTLVAGGGRGEGTYLLLLEAAARLPKLTTHQPLPFQLSGQRPLAYMRLEVRKAGLFRLSTDWESAGAAPLLSLYTQTGAQVRSSIYRQGSNLDPLQVESDQSYLLLAELPLIDSEAGGVGILHLVPSAHRLLRGGETLSADLTPLAAGLHFFAGRAGEKISLHLAWLAGDIAPSLYVAGVDGEPFLFSSTSPQGEALTVVLVLPQDGLYLIQVSDGRYTGGSGRYRLGFVRVKG
jgi:hypothetical protein